jgi:hypothetical protein
MTVANKQRGFIEVELDKVRHIRFSLNALEEMEEALGVSVDQFGDALTKGGIKAMRKFLWIGLKQEDPELTEKQVGDMVDIGSFLEMQGKIGEAFAAAIGESGNAKAGAGGPGNRRKN